MVATIGFGRKSLRRFVELLTAAEVETVVDVRRRPDSPFAGYARQRDLPFALERIARIGYEHDLALAPPAESLDRYRKDGDWTAYVHDFESILASAEGIAAMRRLLAHPDRVALVCAEPTAERCHRRLVAERMRTMRPELRITHLV